MAETHPLSDQETTIADLKNEGRAFVDARGWHRGRFLKDLAMCIAAEAGELLQELRFRSSTEIERRMQEDAKFRENVEDEVADVLIFLLDLCSRYRMDMATIVRRKMAKNAQKYPPLQNGKGEEPEKFPNWGWYE